MPISQALFCFDKKLQLSQSLHCFSLLSILVGRGRNIILAYNSQILAMKNRRKWAIENDRLAYNGLKKENKETLRDNLQHRIHVKRECCTCYISKEKCATLPSPSIYCKDRETHSDITGKKEDLKGLSQGLILLKSGIVRKSRTGKELLMVYIADF